MITNKSKPKPNSKQHSIITKSHSQTIPQLMDKARAAQLKRQHLLKSHCNMTSWNPKNSSTKSHCSQPSSNQPTHSSNTSVITTFKSVISDEPASQPVPLPQSASIQSSFRPFQSNRTLEPYLINIKQEYICSTTHNRPQSTHKQQSISKAIQQQTNQPVSNSSSIQLSESRQVSEEMLLHNSVTSKFLQSPTLSLGLVQSKITKKQVDSQNNSKVLKKKTLKTTDYESGQILFLANPNEETQHKQSLRFYQQLIKTYQTHQQQYAQQNEPPKNKQLKDIGQQFPDPSNIQELRQNMKTKPIQTKTLSPLDPQINNAVIASYQMQVEYLRKINLYQCFQIQKLRKLIRTTQHQHQRSTSINPQIHHHLNQPPTKSNFKKAIDIIKPRQPIISDKRRTQPLQQINSNTKNISTQNTDQQFMFGDYSSDINNKRSVSFTTNHLTTAETFYPHKKTTMNDKKTHKSKAKKRALSISDNHTYSYNCQPQTLPLQYKSQSLNMSTQQMMNLSMQKHNLSCSTYFMATKSIKKSAKAKTSQSQRNLSTIVSSSNKENHAPRQGTKPQNKNKTKKSSILVRDMEMFIVAKKPSEQIMTKKKK